MEEKCNKHQFPEFLPAHFCLPCSPSQAWQVRKTDTTTTLQILCCRKKRAKLEAADKQIKKVTLTRARKRLNQSFLSYVAQHLHPHQGEASPCPSQDGQPCATQVLQSTKNPRPEHGRRARNTLVQHHTPGGGQPQHGSTQSSPAEPAAAKQTPRKSAVF